MPQVSLSDLVSGVRSGSALASFPTDTVPALAARPDQAALIFAVKQRSLEKPLILMAATSTDLWPYVAGSDSELEHWQQMAQRYWPGALTLVLPASDRVPAAIHPLPTATGSRTVGIRVPAHPIAQLILHQTGALATTSANRSGQPALLNMADIEQEFPQVLTLQPAEIQSSSQSFGSEPATIVMTSGTPSTVARWTALGWEILRQGAIVLQD